MHLSPSNKVHFAPLMHPTHTPILLHARDPRRGELVVACSDAALARGVRLNMPLAEAAALAQRGGACVIQPHDPAADLAALARLAMKQPRIARLVRRKQVATRFPIKGGKLYVNSTNPLLRLGYRGTIGLKTGSTDEAGHCFVGVVRRGHRELGVILLHSPDTGTQAKQLLSAAFRAGRA